MPVPARFRLQASGWPSHPPPPGKPQFVWRREGREYLDCCGYFATLPVGHNHPGMEEEGFRRSLMTAALSNPANSDIYSRQYAAFVETFRELAVPPEFRYLFFIAAILIEPISARAATTTSGPSSSAGSVAVLREVLAEMGAGVA